MKISHAIEIKKRFLQSTKHLSPTESYKVTVIDKGVDHTPANRRANVIIKIPTCITMLDIEYLHAIINDDKFKSSYANYYITDNNDGRDNFNTKIVVQ